MILLDLEQSIIIHRRPDSGVFSQSTNGAVDSFLMYSLSTPSLRESPAYINKGQGMNGFVHIPYPEELAAGEDLTQKEGEE